jgi:hypothetical protein
VSSSSKQNLQTSPGVAFFEYSSSVLQSGASKSSSLGGLTGHRSLATSHTLGYFQQTAEGEEFDAFIEEFVGTPARTPL